MEFAGICKLFTMLALTTDFSNMGDFGIMSTLYGAFFKTHLMLTTDQFSALTYSTGTATQPPSESRTIGAMLAMIFVSPGTPPS